MACGRGDQLLGLKPDPFWKEYKTPFRPDPFCFISFISLLFKQQVLFCMFCGFVVSLLAKLLVDCARRLQGYAIFLAIC